MMTDSTVHRRTFRVELKDGLHLRPFSMISKCASEFVCDIKLIIQDRSLDAKSLLELMTMGADAGAFGTEMTLEASGTDSREAVEAIGMLFDSGFPFDEPSAN